MIDHNPYGRVFSWTDGVELGGETIQQAYATSRLKYVFKHVALMPDAHLGIGATVGSVVPTKGAIVPAAVGVDIGCGMMARKLPGTSLKNMDASDLAVAREAIEKVLPVGFNAHTNTPEAVLRAWSKMDNIIYRDMIIPAVGEKAKQSPVRQLGTMGGGNHFLELCLDENDEAWIMLHSGSRGIGNRIGRHFIEIAKRECEKWGIELPHRDLAYLPEGTDHFLGYMQAVEWAQNYAAENRRMMMTQALNALKHLGGDNGWGWVGDYGSETYVECHHNYVAREHHFGENVLVTRKGAVRARQGDMGIIPGSMGAKSFIVRGLGNPMSFNSCSHGAGRRMSRRKAKETFTIEDLREATEGIECRKDSGVIDEIPGAYKDIDAVMDAQKDLVEVVHTLRQVMNIKG
jgi:tRNA-splicing ligase RtcB